MIVSFGITPTKTFAQFIQETRRAYLLAVVQRASGVVTEAARFAGVTRTTMSGLLADYGLSEYALGLRTAVNDLKCQRLAELKKNIRAPNLNLVRRDGT